MNWNLQHKLEKLIGRNVKEIPYEGTQVDTMGLQESFAELAENISIGFITWCFTNKIERNPNGYLFEEKHWSRRDLFNEFLIREFK